MNTDRFTLIGFDIRTPGRVGYSEETSSGSEQPFRPQGDDAAPWITFDKYVNPSVFLAEDRTANEMRDDVILVPANSNSGFDLFALWDNQQDMLVHYTKGEEAQDAAFAYATVDLQDHGLFLPTEDTVEVLVSRQITPVTPQEDWLLLGYDVVSPYFISALSGYLHSDTDPELVRNISVQINPFGLVTAKTKPSTLVSITSSLNEELAEDPFFLIAIFLIWDNSRVISRTLGPHS